MIKYNLKYPQIREQFICCLSALADKDYQISAWIHKKFPQNIEWDSLDMQIHFLFDDSGLDDDPEGAIGIFLVENEINGVKDLLKNLNILFEKYDYDLSDEEYIEKPEWQEILTSAKTLLNLALENNRKYNFKMENI